jgi:AraC-like DNA-binding protein
MPHSDREVYDGPSTLLPELTMAGHARFRSADALPPHAHAGAFEICYLVSGSVDWWAGRELLEVRGGEVYLTRPNELHGGQHAVMNPCELYWFQLTPPRRRPLPGLTKRESDELLRRLNGLRPYSFLASAQTAGACRHLHALHRNPRRGVMTTIAARAALHAMLTGVVNDADAARAARRASERTARAMRFMLAQDVGSFQILDVANEVGLSVSTLHANFIKETGLTPATWRMRQAVARAKAMLAAVPARPVTQIAMELGFSSSQYFATAFRRVTGLTPSAYTAQIAGNASPRPSGQDKRPVG